ncbi:MAG: carbohydrate kinase family protein [Patescibacteria group bacterium]
MNQPSIDVYSTVAHDVVIDHKQGKTSERIGGPATFISAVMKMQGIEEHCHVGPVVEVCIEVNEQGEIGSVTPVAQNKNVPVCKSGSALISTLSREWDPVAVFETCNELYLDVQGFVRAPNIPGQKRLWKEFEGDWIKNVRCLKATELELSFIPAESVEDQKTRILLVTKGANGVDAYTEGRHMSFQPPRVVSTKDTIGAGDTFFAHTVARIILGDSLETAIAVALEQTCQFLENKA